MAFTGLKDTDLIILSKLDDEDLLNVCSEKNSYLNRICKDENFWRNRFINKYGEAAAKYKPENRLWKRHYLKVLVDLQKFKNDPVKFLDLILWTDKGFKYSEFINEYGWRNPLLSAPEWIMNNFWLLDLGVIKLKSVDPTGIYSKNVYYHLKPFQILEKQKTTSTVYLNGLMKIYDYYTPRYASKRESSPQLHRRE